MLFQFDDIHFKLFRLGEKAILISSDPQTGPEVFRNLSELLLLQRPAELEDVITAYNSIAITFKDPVTDMGRLSEEMSALDPDDVTVRESGLIDLPVCYELGMDWNDVERETGLRKSEVIRIHSQARYEVAMLGFLPGFIYLNGLPEALFCPRRKIPRTAVPAGSVGIGGDHTGMYSLSSPGGWQIIGMSPVKLFDIKEDPPIKLRPGDRIRFVPVSEEEYHKRNSDES